MAQSEVLKAQKRAKLGSHSARSLRAEGRVPANLQGDGAHIDFSIDLREFLATRRHHTHLYDIDIDGEVKTAVVRELQWDTFGDNIVHVEFKSVTRGVETEAEVAIEWVGQPKGVLNHLVEHVTIRCIPSLIPDFVEVKVEGLDEGTHLKAKDIQLPAGLSLAIPGNSDIATIISAHGHEREGEEGEGEEGAEPTA
ncbi:MAG: 50S ribosomal protein L25 [Planctomycetes bacterium]|nr:50S ribosomal protein L25 [Planctomycetota bacterium]